MKKEEWSTDHTDTVITRKQSEDDIIAIFKCIAKMSDYQMPNDQKNVR